MTQVERITWDLSDVRAALGVGEHTLRAWVARLNDPIPHVRAGRRVLFDPDDVRAWFRRQADRAEDRARADATAPAQFSTGRRVAR
jgi:hypothetical protein